MKKCFLILTQLLILSIFTNAQSQSPKQKPTTQEEYNYVTKGYKNHIADGSDMKKGYTISHLFEEELGERKLDINGLMRDGETLPCAIMLVYRKNDQGAEYLCMPTGNADPSLWSNFFSSLDDNYGSQTDKFHFLTYCLAEFNMQLIQSE